MLEAADNDPFNPPGVSWHTVSPALARVRRQVLALWLLVPALAVAALAVWLRVVWLGAVAAVLAAAFGYGWWLVGRQVAALAYAQRDDELLVRRGVLLRKLDIVPYGRMQMVDVTAGPFAARAGIATVQLHTASPTTDAEIPGLVAQEAAALRDQLTALGQAHLVGL